MESRNRIKRLSIKAFRGLRNLEFDDLKTINVFLGVNNSGKTSVLESIGLMSDVKNRAVFQKWSLYRSPSSKETRPSFVDYMSSIFPNSETGLLPIDIELCTQDETYKTEITGQKQDILSSNGKINKALKVDIKCNENEKPVSLQFKEGGKSTFKIENSSIYNVECLLVDEDNYGKSVSYFSSALLDTQKEELLILMRDFDESIIDVFLDEKGDIYIQNSISGVLPLFAYGSGMQKAFLLSTIIAQKDIDIVLVDEIDSTLNISALKDVLTWFVNACRKLNIQAFITTHNMEAVDAILDNIDNESEDINIITLRRTAGSMKTIAKSLNGKKAYQLRKEFEMELRV